MVGNCPFFCHPIPLYSTTPLAILRNELYCILQYDDDKMSRQFLQQLVNSAAENLPVKPLTILQGSVAISV